MNLQQLISVAEKSLKKDLEEYFVSFFDENKIPSHGLGHHKRVWNYAKEILDLCRAEEKFHNPEFISSLLLASLMHDSGMSVDHGERHGIISRDLAESFLTEKGIPVSGFTEALKVIGNHDRKDYNDSSLNGDLHKILSAADDLDAYGYTGIYRYLEIYLMRDTDPYKLGEKILDNARVRFSYLVDSFGSYGSFIEKHKNRFSILESFCKGYSLQAGKYNFGAGTPVGYCGVAETINGILRKDTTLDEILALAGVGRYEQNINNFFNSLGNELNSDAVRS